MTRFLPEHIAEVLAVCTEGAGKAAESLERVLGVKLKLQVEAGAPLLSFHLTETLRGGGLAVRFKLGDVGALLIIPSESEIIPDWCRHPDATGQSKLDALAQELGKILFPVEFGADGFQARWVDDLAATLQRCQPATEHGTVKLHLTSGQQAVTASLIWPVTALESAWPTPAEPAVPAPAPESAGNSEPAFAAASSAMSPETSYADLEDGLRLLPAYAHSLLKIKLPVVVTLAESKQSVHRILNMGPGSILQFPKACDELLSMEIGRTRLALGEAVKVGDKFGLWITSMVLPDERFGPAQHVSLKSPQAS